ncbi:MAG: hypothetical protein HC845_01460 [Akkermansiaceae bacterium]|nr:hypothetical protein [Akkermansiaceae bacterium]
MKSITFALLSIVPTFAQVIPNGASADLVLGQANFTVNTAGTSATKLSDPAGVVIDPTTRKVFVSDRGNKRVLRFSDMNALASGAAAEWVVGQPNFTSNGMGTTANTFGQFGPGGIYLDTSGRLWVADTGNCRVLRFDNALTATANQPNAARVYGQSNFTNSAPGTSATTMRFPASVLVDSGDRLWVVDIGNNRVLRFNSVSTHTTNGVAASGVLGQLNFTSANALPLEANSMDGPEGITMSSNGTLYVSDFERILRFNNAAALSNGANASGILGQPSFTESTFGGPSANYTNGPSGLLITVNDVLWVCDRKNNRMIYINSASTK